MGLADSVRIAILAGGQSSRMGTDKALVRLDGKPIIQHVIERLQPLGLPLTLITNTPDAYAEFGPPMVGDVLPNNGSLGGIYTALVHSETPYTLIVGCDMPLLNADLLAYLIEQRESADIIVPIIADRPENLHAVYHRACLPVIREQIDSGVLKVNRLLDRLTVHRVDEPTLRRFDPDLRSFINVNTPDDLARVAGMIKE